jgi:hypothetical protein
MKLPFRIVKNHPSDLAPGKSDVASELMAIGLPLLGAVLGGPPGLAVGAVSLANKALGLPNSSSVKDISNTLRDNPQGVQKLQDLEISNQAYLLSVKLQMDQAEFADKANARAREVEITKATGRVEWFPPILGVIVVSAFTVVLCSMVFLPPSKEKRDESTTSLINILVGALTAGYSTVLGYYFGSSAGSRNKDYTIAALNTNIASSATLENANQPPVDPLALATPLPSSQRKTWRDP